MCTALVFVDDATSRLMSVKFTTTESTFAYFEALREYLGRYGKPLALYSDKATMAAKGRVERAHLTLQDRLVKEFRLAGISNIAAANALMPGFIEAYNGKFAKVPRNAHDAHRPLRPEEDLELILAWRELRKVSQNLLLHYERKLYVLVDTPENRRLIGKYVEVFQYPDGRIEIRVAGQALPYSLYINSGTINQGQGAIVENKRLGHALQVLQEAQARREPLRQWAPSTAHRADGAKVARSQLVRSQKPRGRISQQAMEALPPELLPPLAGRQTARQGGSGTGEKARKADIST
jgi:hypothetical protein